MILLRGENVILQNKIAMINAHTHIHTHIYTHTHTHTHALISFFKKFSGGIAPWSMHASIPELC